MEDGHGLDANDWRKLEQKYRQHRGFIHVVAHAPEMTSIENQNSVSIARCRSTVSMDDVWSGSLIVRASAVLSRGARPRARWRD